ncbi:MAG: ABC transporter permease, partial [Acidimicrobiales bacterium]|nr:ABC transporter permease [Acidimicrobiales bacterium]
MPGVLVIAGNDLKRRLRDRSVVIQGVLGPVVLAAIIGFAFGGQLNFHARIGLVDADRSDLSRGVLESIGADQPANSPIEFVRLDPDVVDDRIESGEVDAAVVFP